MGIYKGDIFNEFNRGTFLTSLDKFLLHLLHLNQIKNISIVDVDNIALRIVCMVEYIHSMSRQNRDRQHQWKKGRI